MIFLVNQLVIQLTMRAMELICSLFFSLFRGMVSVCAQKYQRMMVMARICMIWSYGYAILSGGLLKFFSNLQCKIVEKGKRPIIELTFELDLVLIETTVSFIFLESMDLFGTFVGSRYRTVDSLIL
jgi:hypothetical protein